ncbi:hypothetical protein QJS04_geneDACA017040 [Acorus gramineus]|uniref:DUF641 domain-containing protein n=1 Tax=Acorus gramineus TaxID=55184 RepID=A0AAV9AK17_ACOGR|nr:hypothetical protein QJS04_geneDACA017040 [Acorus gramineus]
MESFSSTKPTKHSSNLSEMVHRFARLCRLKSVGVVSASIPVVNPSIEGHCSTSTSTEETESKVHPHMVEEEEDPLTVIFEAVSSLKWAYVRLQEAHIPYDPEKFSSADAFIMAELKSLAQIESSYQEKQKDCVLGCGFPAKSDLCEEIAEKERLLEELQSRIRSQDSEILCLSKQIDETDRENAKSQLLSAPVVCDAFESTSKSIHDFAKPLIGLMKASNWDLSRAAKAIENGVSYAERSHKKYAFEAYLCRKMFDKPQQFSPEFDNVDSIMAIRDPFKALIEDPDSGFGRFCRDKYLSVVHSKMEASFFGNLDQRVFVSNGGHPNTPLYKAFVKMARWVWVVLAMLAGSNRTAEMFWVERGTAFDEAYMESVVKMEERRLNKVGLMVIPGLRYGETIIRSKVYIQ